MGILSYSTSNIGLKRSTNQDSIFADDRMKMYIVADGMGGHQGGDIASQMTVAIMPEAFKALPDEEDPTNNLRRCIYAVNDAIFKKSLENPLLKGMGTTIVSLYFKGKHLYISNVGDSRAYLINNNMLYQMSKDHSLVQEKLNIGIYDREAAQQDKQKNVLVRAVGFEEQLEADVFCYKVLRNDIFLICSDGLHGMVSDHDIVHLIKQNIPDPSTVTKEMLQKAVDALIALALNNGGKDNVSAILVAAH